MSTASPRRSDLVHERLRRDILGGALAPGEPVPSERVLAEDLGVNRHAVREALKRLEQAGLVRISQGGATRVLDWREHGGIDVLLDLVGGSRESPPREVVRAVLEFREAIGVDAARRCAERSGDEARRRILKLSDETADVLGGHPRDLDERYGALWECIVAGSGNVAYRLALNSLQAALDALPDVAELTLPKDGPALRALGAAIARGDGASAASAAQALLGADRAAA